MTKPLLRPLDPERDGEALHAIFGDEECCRYMPDPAVARPEDTVAMLKKWNEGTEDTTWAIVDEPEGVALGRMTMIPRGDKIWEVGIMVVPSAHGRGLATGAVAQGLDVVFDKHQARRIYADVDPDNIASRRIFEKLGFQHEGVFRAAWDTHIGVRDSDIFSLIDTDPKNWR
ncbi:MAG: hypothetical protein DHS20C05_25180 [Hyphococcus sp.]|nr:MAG: hypothetical protein DHS20C05_25180 [Marinicaulis sp.]